MRQQQCDHGAEQDVVHGRGVVGSEAGNHAPNAAVAANIAQTRAVPAAGRCWARWAARSEPVAGTSAANGPSTGCRGSWAASPAWRTAEV